MSMKQESQEAESVAKNPEWAVELWESNCGKLSHSQKGMLNFILSSQRLSLREKVEGMRQTHTTQDVFTGNLKAGYNQALSDILTEITEI